MQREEPLRLFLNGTSFDLDDITLCFWLLVESQKVFDLFGLIVEFKNVSINKSLSREVEGVRPVEGDEPTNLRRLNDNMFLIY